MTIEPLNKKGTAGDGMRATPDKTKMLKMARLLAKLWANNRTDYGFLRDDALQLLKQAYALGRKKKP